MESSDSRMLDYKQLSVEGNVDWTLGSGRKQAYDTQAANSFGHKQN